MFSLISLLAFSCKKNETTDTELVKKGKVTFSEAQEFMQNRCANIGQTLMKGKTVNYNGIQLYMFMSVAENGDACISSVTENALEVFATDCGTAEMKVSEWNALH